MATRLADPGTPPPNSARDGQGCRRCFCLDLNPTWGLRASGRAPTERAAWLCLGCLSCSCVHGGWVWPVGVHREPPSQLLLGGWLSRGLGRAQLRGGRPGGVGLGPAVAWDTASRLSELPPLAVTLTLPGAHFSLNVSDSKMGPRIFSPLLASQDQT